jgi:hypothetical protein
LRSRRSSFLQKTELPRPRRQQKGMIAFLTLLQKCFLAVEFGVSRVQPFCACP